MRRFIGALMVALYLVGCSGDLNQAPAKNGTAEAQPDERPSTNKNLPLRECKQTAPALSVYGLGLGAPVGDLTKQFGPPLKTEKNAQNAIVTYEYDGMFLMVSEQDETLWLLEVRENAARREVLPGISVGDAKESVLKALDAQGLCVRDPNAAEWGVFGEGVRLVLTYRGDKLTRVRLEHNGV